MTTKSVFYYPITIHRDAVSFTDVAPFIKTLPLSDSVSDQAAILSQDAGDQAQGLYVFDGSQWRFAMPMPPISASIIRGDALDIYINATLDVTLPPTVTIYKNGYLQPTDIITHGGGIYAVQTPPAGGSGGGAVDSVNGQTGNVTINATNLPGLSTVGKTGQYTDLIGAPAAYVLPVSTASVLGGVMVPGGSNISIDSSGIIDVKASLITTINGKLSNTVTSGIGTSVVRSVAAGVVTLKSLQAGTNISIVDDAAGTLTVNASFTVPVATASTVGGIKVGSGLTVAGDGTLSANAQALTPATAAGLGGVIVPASSNISVDVSGNIDVKAALLTIIGGKVDSVVANGGGSPLVRQRVGNVITLNDLVAGSNVTITDNGSGGLVIDSTGGSLPIASASVLGGIKIGAGLTIAGDGTLSNGYVLPAATPSILGGVKQGSGTTIDPDGTIHATQYTLPQATAGVLGGIKVGAGLAIAGDGTLSVSSSYTLPQASASVLGGVKVGTTMSIAGDGTLDANLPVAATSSVIGLVKPGTGLTVAGDGTLNASASVPATATTLGNVIVGSGINVAGDGTISVTFPVSSVNTKTGAVSITAGNGITVNNGGANIVVSLNLAAADVNTALGYTAYNGVANPLGFLTANQAITYTGDATGTGTTAVALTLAASGVGAGSYTNVTVDTKGRVTAGSNPTTLAGYGIVDALSIHGGSVDGNINLTSGATIKNVPAPATGTDAVNQTYVDNAIASIANGVTWRANAQAASTVDLPLTGLSTIDDYVLLAGDRVLVKDQVDQTANGVYIAAAGAWARALDTDTGAELLNMAILVLNGTVQGRTQWVNSNTSAIIVGTTNITYAELQGPSVAYTASTGLTLTGNAFSITNTGVVAGTYTKVTVNAQGQVTTGAALASGDVTTALGFTPYNASNPSGYISANQTITVSGDATASGSTALALTLASTGVTAGTYKSVTVDVKGRVTAGTNPTTLAGYGIVDALSNTGGNVSGNITMTTGATVTGLPTPVAGADAANKTYTDAGNLATYNSIAWKNRVAVATTANITLSGTQTIDGYAVQAGDRVLVKDQTTATQNGVYVAAAGAWARAADAAIGANLIGLVAIVLNGTVGALTQYLNTNTSAITVGTTNVTFAQTAAAGTAYTAGTGLTLTTNQFSITNTGVVAGTYTKVTVNAQGQVTTGAALASGDVTTALGYTPLQNNQAITLSGDVTGTGTTAITSTLSNTAVAAGSYGDATHVATFTVDAKGRLTAAGTVAITAGAVTSVFGQTGAIANLSGDVTTAGSSVTTLSNSGVTAGTYTKVTVDVKGRVTVGAALASGDVTTALGYTPLNKAGDTMSGTFNQAPTVNVSSAATALVGSALGNDINMLGTTTITAFDNAPVGAVRTIKFAGILTLTHNASTFVLLNNGANIVTAAGDSAQFTSIGASSWRMDYYQKANGQPLQGSPDATKLPLAGGTMSGAINGAPTVVLGVAATVNIGAAAANDILINGAGSITAFDTVAAGTVRTVLFNGNVTLTHNGASLILPTATNISAVANDTAQFVSLGSGNWRCQWFQRFSGQSLAPTSDATKLSLTGGSMTGAINESAQVGIVAAATTPIGSTNTNNISISTSTTITAFDNFPAGAVRTISFFGAPLLTHNATSLILPTAANIQVVSGDSAAFLSLGSGNWLCLWYQRKSGQALAASPDASKLPLAGGTMTGALNGATPVTLASAATVNIGAAAANDITVSGTTTITAFDSIPAGAVRKLTFSGALTLTHNATSLILLGGANITTAAGDVAQFTSLGAGNWRCDFYSKAAGGFATLTGTETLTNKTLTNAVITGFIETGATATGSAFSPDFTTGTDFEYTTNANTTITLATPVAGRSYTICIIYGGAHTVTFAGGGTIKYAGGVAPTATSVAGKRDYYTCKCDRAGTFTSVLDSGRNF